MTIRSDMARRALLRVLPAVPALGLAGCFGGGRMPHVWWELDDARADEAGRAEPDAARAKLSMLVEGVAAGARYDGTALLYSRGAGMRAPYQYASWTERPAARLARLARRRLQARGGFRDVSLAEAGTAPELLLTLTLETLHHELAPDVEGGQGGMLRLAVSAQLLDWRARRPLASRAFDLAEPVASADAAGAVRAAGRAVAGLLDALAPWVETSAADYRVSGVRPPAPN
ncbi:ABC-type transport auxiliary lipoprotein family protein [Zeimonas arvi]|uniref:ABC-type transport auxiliary lipoprotein component domain-containing protein n=1 Tax=Zeimonas arvi TaxID=2498847 RepID=A0A5C8NWR5_9BURK|nr:ABC-type transport auxiliary lipoprotein family protein [Zeimonas arvi]TXL65512.1 hypothetical protein FHP08_12100 [Zeimonas arvi]